MGTFQLHNSRLLHAAALSFSTNPVFQRINRSCWKLEMFPRWKVPCVGHFRSRAFKFHGWMSPGRKSSDWTTLSLCTTQFNLSVVSFIELSVHSRRAWCDAIGMQHPFRHLFGYVGIHVNRKGERKNTDARGNPLRASGRGTKGRAERVKVRTGGHPAVFSRNVTWRGLDRASNRAQREQLYDTPQTKNTQCIINIVQRAL